MNKAKPQDGSTVKGYQTLSYDEIGKMYQLKELSRQLIALLHQHGMDINTDPSLQNSPECWDAHERLREAHKDMQRDCIAACRAVARPDSNC
ncbi:hypothetical protein D9O29_01485 [Pantoea vagans]|uniref:Uncharacterized protein n=1 Tax=Pantoea vagans TaxID=470934 RepID=A0ABY3LKG0_9GAMM|nr:hypothetical protein D9O29_01485 [Pantoea vagans]